MNIRSLVTCACAAAFALFISGCNNKGDDDNGASVRLVNASSNFSTMDLYAASSVVSTGVASYTAGAYANASPGAYAFNFDAGGTGVISATLSSTVVQGVDYTFVAYTTGGVLTAQMLTDNQAAPASGLAALRIFHTAATDVGNVDVYLVTSACSNLPNVASSPIASGVSGLQTAFTNVNATAAGTAYHVCVTAAGDNTDLRLDIPALTLTSQQVATLILTNTSGGVLLNGLLLNQQGTLTPELNQSVRMRLAAGASGQAPVTATANGVSLGTGLTAPAVSSYQLVPAGALTLAVTVAGNNAAASSTATVAAGGDFTLLVTGTAASAPVMLVDNNALSTSTANPTKLRLVNGMTGTGSTATLTYNYSNIGNGAVFGAASTYSLVPASSTAQLQSAYGTATLCQSTGITLATASVYTVFLLGDIPVTAGTCVLISDR